MVVLLTKPSGEREDLLRFFGITLAVVLLNVGFYFILWLFAAVVAGAVGGFFIMKAKTGSLVGFTGSLFAYLPLLMVLESIAPTGADIFSIILAVLILSLLGSLGGFIGGIVGKRPLRGPLVG
ncbi:MAG: hypothetical protein EAX95_09035 [Candidatus Thorarchaeota archaeon]|nr:hypothetical protein [Candidatus Thorarchaeota archaeon]